MRLSKNLHTDMSKTTKTIIFAATAVILIAGVVHELIPAVAYAAEEGAKHETSFKEWFWLVVNFLILVSVLVFFLKKPLSEYYKQRTELLEKALFEARQARELAEKALVEIEQQLKLKDEEIKRMIDAAIEAGEADSERHIAEGKATSEAIERLAWENVEYEMRKAKAIIRKKAAAAIASLAADKISKVIDDEIAAKLINDSISKIGQGT
ncbi:MAG: ATP synthase F0 subunit B [Nitrospirae bacterium]|nr:ATP synthase F0 subunit B [Nitrospirota bacterium]